MPSAIYPTLACSPSDKKPRRPCDESMPGTTPTSRMDDTEKTGARSPELLEQDEDEKLLVRKLDLHIIPMVMLLYLFSFLDRVNIGNARLYGLEEELGMHGNQYQLAVSILFVTYLAFEIPSNLVLKKFTPRRYIAGIAFLWGILALCTGLVQSYGGLLAVRLLLGAVEAGLFPGLQVYLTLFYKKSELALRIGYLFVSAALAGACGGLLAYAIGFMDGLQGMAAWRWILILEGIPAVLLGVVTYFVFADSPESAWYLTEKEKAVVERRMGEERENTKGAREFHWEDVRKCFRDWRVYGFALAQFGVDTMLYGYSTFLPTIIKAIGSWTTAEVQALTIPCYAAGAITYMLIARLSDHHRKRGIYSILFALISIIGYALLLSASSPGVHYLGCFIVAIGLYVSVGLCLCWLPNNCPRYGKRTAACGMQLTVGNSAGIMAPFIYPSTDGPRYVKGHAVSLGMVAFGGCCFAVLWAEYGRVNRRRERGEEEWKKEGKTEVEVTEMGDESPDYRFTI